MATRVDIEAAVLEVRRILDGIDREEGYNSNDGGWWETSHGVAFGAGRLAELESYIRDLLADSSN